MAPKHVKTKVIFNKLTRPPSVVTTESTSPTTSTPQEPSPSSTHSTTESKWCVNALPTELQVRILSYLRAHDLSKVHQVNRHMAFSTQQLQHDIVLYCASQVYPPKWTVGFQDQPTTKTTNATMTNMLVGRKTVVSRGKARSGSFGSLDDESMSASSRKHRSCSFGSVEDKTCTAVKNGSTLLIYEEKQANSTELIIHNYQLPEQEEQSLPLYTFEHLRNMELLVVARVLNSPEPTTGFVVSKSWCKTALCWLEGQQERRYEQQQQAIQAAMEGDSNKKKKLARKMKIKTSRKSHQRATTPPPNINSDITCAHDQLQHCTSTKSARARRRILDKQAWKILKVLYPESTPIPAQSGECIQCIAEACQIQKNEQDQQEALKEQRKLPLQNPQIRRFYTRTRGVPETCLRTRSSTNETKTTTSLSFENEKDTCPLIDGTYYVLPRSWCHGWRRFMKTGEGGSAVVINHTNGTQTYTAPDASCLLCDAHRLALLPPHLEAYLYGESDNLFDSSGSVFGKNMVASSIASLQNDSAENLYPSLPPGQAPTQESILAMRSLGLDENEIGRQLSALRLIEARNERINYQDDVNNAVSRNELLDQENYHVVEILSELEFRNLLGCWSASTSVYVLQFIVLRGVVTTIAATTERDSLLLGIGEEEARRADFCISVCRNCDATGRYHCVKGKQRCTRSSNSGSWSSKKQHHANHDRSRAVTSLEY
jgi:hypothetical protein